MSDPFYRAAYIPESVYAWFYFESGVCFRTAVCFVLFRLRLNSNFQRRLSRCYRNKLDILTTWNYGSIKIIVYQYLLFGFKNKLSKKSLKTTLKRNRKKYILKKFQTCRNITATSCRSARSGLFRAKHTHRQTEKYLYLLL